jgi:hypothetical protein
LKAALADRDGQEEDEIVEVLDEEILPRTKVSETSSALGLFTSGLRGNLLVQNLHNLIDEAARRADDDRVTWTGKRVRGAETENDGGDSGVALGLFTSGLRGNLLVQNLHNLIFFLSVPICQCCLGNFSSW